MADTEKRTTYSARVVNMLDGETLGMFNRFFDYFVKDTIYTLEGPDYTIGINLGPGMVISITKDAEPFVQPKPLSNQEPAITLSISSDGSYTCPAGINIDQAAKIICDMANAAKASRVLQFNGYYFVVEPNTEPSVIVDRYFAKFTNKSLL